MSKSKSAKIKEKQLSLEKWQSAQKKSSKNKTAKNRSYFSTPKHAKVAGWVYIANAVLLFLIIIFIIVETKGGADFIKYVMAYIVLTSLCIWQLISGLKLIKKANDFLKGGH